MSIIITISTIVKITIIITITKKKYFKNYTKKNTDKTIFTITIEITITLIRKQICFKLINFIYSLCKKYINLYNCMIKNLKFFIFNKIS